MRYGVMIPVSAPVWKETPERGNGQFRCENDSLTLGSIGLVLES